MNTHTPSLDHRLRQLRGSGNAPDGIWQRIERDLQASHPPRLNRHLHRAGVAALLCLGLLALLQLSPYRTHGDRTETLGIERNLLPYAAALDQNLRDIYEQWPDLTVPNSYSSALLGPELIALQQARQQVRAALQQQPGSSLLLHQLTQLDHCQYRLARQMSIPRSAS